MLNSTSDDVIKALKALWRKPVRAKNRMIFSSVHGRTFAGQRGVLRGYFVDKDSILAAVSFEGGVAWLDYRDLVLE